MNKPQASFIKPLISVSLFFLQLWSLVEVASINGRELPIGVNLPNLHFLTVSATSSGSQSDTKADLVVSNITKAANGIQTFQANISTETKNLQIGGPSERSSGIVYFKRDITDNDNDILMISYVGPPKRSILMKGDQVEVYQPNIKQLIRTSRDSAGERFTQSYMNLGRNSTLTYVRDENIGGQSTSLIQLVPNEPGNIRSALVWVNRQTWMPVKFEVKYIASKLTVTLSNIKVNKRISDSLLSLKYPNDVRIVTQ